MILTATQKEKAILIKRIVDIADHQTCYFTDEKNNFGITLVERERKKAIYVLTINADITNVETNFKLIAERLNLASKGIESLHINYRIMTKVFEIKISNTWIKALSDWTKENNAKDWRMVGMMSIDETRESQLLQVVAQP